MEFLPKAFDALGNYKQFILYFLQNSKSRTNKMDKIPIDWRTGHPANAHDPAIWLSASEAIAIANKYGTGYGVGFVFTANDPFFFLDIDDHVIDQAWSPLATQLLHIFAGAAYEISNSRRGLHIFGTGAVPPHTCRNAEAKLELYTEGRFVALTGLCAGGDASFDCSADLAWLVDSYFKPGAGALAPDYEWTTEPCAEWRGNVDDNELLARMLASVGARSTFGTGASFRDLYEANETILAIAYPAEGTSTDSYNRSSADAALAQHLAFWTGKNCERIRRIMEGSALRRDKWKREDYLPRTIQGACGRQKDILQDLPPQYTIEPPPDQEDETPRPQLVAGSTFLTIDQQIEYFAGCVYILDEHKVLTPKGDILTPERFRSYLGGYSMPLDFANEKTTRNAFEAFTESQAFRAPRAQSSCFQPSLRSGRIITKDGQRLVNTYFPVETARMAGDPTPFLVHMGKLFPNKYDREVILAYLAAVIQYKGVKFQWAPVIQGVQGNGKTMLTRIVAAAIGQKYCHFPKAADIDNKFNGWLYRMVFVGVEDIYLVDTKTHVVETLKPMVTNERQEVELKGRDKVTVDICANFLINTNHKDGLRKTRDDRRFAPFYTPQQSVDDLTRDGMAGDYFPRLILWLGRQHGYAIVHDYLATYPIPDELNPATSCIRAPQTSSTDAAIEQGVGRIEQEVLEAIEQGISGFRGGWVSSIALDKLLVQIKSDRLLPMRKRRDMMQSIGYDWHRGLINGRVDNTVQPDGGKPRLYIKNGHPSGKIRGGAEIARAYTETQSKTD